MSTFLTGDFIKLNSALKQNGWAKERPAGTLAMVRGIAGLDTAFGCFIDYTLAFGDGSQEKLGNGHLLAAVATPEEMAKWVMDNNDELGSPHSPEAHFQVELCERLYAMGWTDIEIFEGRKLSEVCALCGKPEETRLGLVPVCEEHLQECDKAAGEKLTADDCRGEYLDFSEEWVKEKLSKKEGAKS